MKLDRLESMTPRALVLVALLSAAGNASAQASGSLDIESLLAIRHPSGAAWSPDGSRVAFVWDRGGVQNLYVVGRLSGGPEPLTGFDEGLVSAPSWSADGSLLYYERGSELWSIAVAKGATPKAVFATQAQENGARLSPDGTRVAFIRLGDVWVRQLDSGREKRLTVTLVAESGIEWSPDGARIAFSFSQMTPRDELQPYVGDKISFRRVEQEASDVGVVSVSGGAVEAVAASPASEEAPRWVDGQRLALQRVSSDYRTREILLADVVTGEVSSLHRDFDRRFWSQAFLGSEPRPSPGGKWIAFVSDETGWDSLYVAATEPSKTATVHRITGDGEEVQRFAWSPDGTRIAFDTNRSHPGQRHLAVADVSDPARPKIQLLTEGPGTNTQLADAGGFTLAPDYGGWSRDGQRLLFQHTDSRGPADLYWIEASGESKSPHQLTDSLPASVERSLFIEPELVHYKSTDGREVPAYLFVPQNLDRSRKHPAIVWIHGDGIAQNYDGWHPRRDYAVYYSFHQYLAQRGYVVLAPDYRGSVGYGREWRVEPYHDLGGKDAADIASAVPYLASLLFVDTDRVGVWGLSYGGFLTLQALTRDPELFRCGVDVAGVQDFRYWFRDPGGIWIGGRLGDPRESPEAYVQAAPVERVDRIVRPLLILHGTADGNVPFLESLRLVDELLKKGKGVELAVYPGEFHYFQREHVLRDFFRRVEGFFERNLREGGAGSG